MKVVTREARAWARRVMMGRRRAWVVVEGRKFDATFYARLFMESSAGKIKIKLAEQIEVRGDASGGKAHVLAIFHQVAGLQSVQQANHETRVDVFFAVDRDDDDLLGRLIGDPHVLYSETMDVEGDILSNGKITKAVATAYSVPTSIARRAGGQRVPADIAARWERWTTLRMAAAMGGWNARRFGSVSQINRPLDGPVDVALEFDVIRDLSAQPGWEDVVAIADERRRQFIDHGDVWKVVKGKWVPTWVDFRMQHVRGDWPAVGGAVNLVAVCLAALNFSGRWAEERIAAIESTLSLPLPTRVVND